MDGDDGGDDGTRHGEGPDLGVSGGATAATALAVAVAVVAAQYVVNAVGAARNGASAGEGEKRSGDDRGLELTRRFQHALTGCLFVAASASGVLTWTQQIVTLVLSTAWFYLVHRLRLLYPSLNEYLMANFGAIARPSEAAGRIPGAFFFLLGSSICRFCFRDREFHLGILLLAFGDPAAGLVGTLWKRYHTSGGNQRPSQGKSFAGSTGALVACAAATFVYSTFFDCEHEPLNVRFVLALVAGCIGALAERVDIAGLDDNLTMPVLCASGLHLLWGDSACNPANS